ncbi:MAG: histidine kinase [Crocinitomicaceae bacterium]|nr:histidine kinase [Crocinitomicaceae bacterium]
MSLRLLIFCLAINALVFSQRYSFITFGTGEGLPQSQVTAIQQDMKGYLWVGTFNGLAKFNGTKFDNFTTAEGLLSNRTTGLFFVGDTLFVGHDSGVSFRCKRNTFCTYLFEENIDPANVTGVLRYQNNTIISTNGSGLLKLKGDRLSAIDGAPSRIRGMVEVDGELWLATREGIIGYDGTFNNKTCFPDASYSSISFKDDEIFTTTFSGVLYRYKPKHNKLEEVFADDNYLLRNVKLTSDDAIWLSSDFGALKLSGKDVLYLNEKAGLPLNDVTTVFEDKEGNIWLGTSGKGLIKFAGELFVYFNKKSGLPSDLPIAIVKGPDDLFWVSFYDKGVYALNPKTNEVLANRPPIEGVTWTAVTWKNAVYFGSTLGLWAVENGNWKVWTTENGLTSNKITALKPQGENLLVGTSNGLVLLDESGKITPVHLGANYTPINPRSFLNTTDGVLIAAQNGLFRLKNNQIELLHQFSGGLNALGQDQSGQLWIGSENGLFIKNNDGEIMLMPEHNFGGSAFINFIQNINGDLFVGTNLGLYLYQHLEQPLYFGLGSGLLDLETNLNAVFQENNYIWFGTAAGLMRMNLNQLAESKVEQLNPDLHVRSISANFEALFLDDYFHWLYSKQSQPITFSHKKNNLSFEMDGIYLKDPQNIFFSHFLEGFSDTWSPPTKNNFINFTNLSPGKYQLKVKLFLGLQATETLLTIDFIIAPPFYQTWWFYLLLGVFVISAILYIDHLRAQALKRQNYRKNLEIRNKLNQLEQQSLNANMNRHFIFNSLNAIQYYINSSDNRSANRFLTQFAKLIRKNLDASNDASGMVRLSDELERLELYLQLESMRFKAKFQYEINIDPKVEIDMLKVPAMFLQPFVENSIIHGVLPLKERKGVVKIDVSDHLDHIGISIFDNGIGYDSSLYDKKSKDFGDHKSLGVEITRGRIELLQRISAKSISMTGPLQINEKDSSVKGTEVKFKILKQYLVD